MMVNESPGPGYSSMSRASSSDRSLVQLSEVWSSGSLMASSDAYFFVYSEADRWGESTHGGGGDDVILVNDVILSV